MWGVISLKIRAQKNESWIEAISLSYTLLEVELRLLLSSKASNSGRPVPIEKINKQKHLMDLANLAKRKGFIGADIWKTIRDFNDVRNRAIHGYITGEVSYSELREPALTATEVIGAVQDRWLPIEWGQEERTLPTEENL